MKILITLSFLILSFSTMAADAKVEGVHSYSDLLAHIDKVVGMDEYKECSSMGSKQEKANCVTKKMGCSESDSKSLSECFTDKVGEHPKIGQLLTSAGCGKSEGTGIGGITSDQQAAQGKGTKGTSK